MSTLIESIKGMMTPQLFGSLAARTGVSDTKVRNGMTAASGAVLEGIAGKARDPGAMNDVVGLIDAAPGIDDPARMIEDDGALHQVGRLLALATSDAPGLIKRIASMLGIGGGAASGLVTAAAGIVLGGLRRFSRSRGGIDASSLSSTLIEEAPSIRAAAMPPTVIGERVAETRVVHPAETVRLERPMKRSPLTWLLAAIPLVLIGIWLAKRPHRTAETTTGYTVGEVVRQSRDAVPRLEPPAIETPQVTTPEVAQTQPETAPPPMANTPPEESDTGKLEYGSATTPEPSAQTPSEEQGSAVAPEPSAQTPSEEQGSAIEPKSDTKTLEELGSALAPEPSEQTPPEEQGSAVEPKSDSTATPEEFQFQGSAAAPEPSEQTPPEESGSAISPESGSMESGSATAPEPSAQAEPMDQAASMLEKQAAGSEKKEWVDLTLNFDTGKANVPASGDDELASIATVLQNNPDLKIEVAGFTDATGSAKRNMALSALRAQSVKQALVAKGIDAARIKTKAFGSTNLAEQTKEAAEANRRVAVRIMGH